MVSAGAPGAVAVSSAVPSVSSFLSAAKTLLISWISSSLDISVPTACEETMPAVSSTSDEVMCISLYVLILMN